MKTLSKLLCITTIASIFLISTAAYAESHSSKEMVIKDLGNLGKVSFATSCKADAQKAINTGVGLLHHMMYAQAEALFSHWIKQEPDCAILYWGYSMSLYHPLWAGVIKEEALIRGASALTKAQGLTSTKREQAYINAASQYFQDWKNTSNKDRTAKWAKAQAVVYEQNPDDIDAAAFSALSQLAIAPKNDPMFTKNKQAGALLAKFREASPTHPGLIHYTIHAYDNPPLAELGIDAASAYGNIAPDVPHALHMPSHIYIRLGMWDEAVTWDLRSAEAALKYPVAGKTSHHYTHALDYLIYAYLQQGEGDKAKQAFEQAETHHPILPIYPTAYAFSAIPARIALEQHKWQQASQIKVQHPSYIAWEKFPQLEAITYYARGLGAARSGDLKLAQQSVDVLNDLHDKTNAISPGYWAVLVDAQRMAVTAWISFGKGQKEQALTQLRQAADLEDSKDKNPVTPGAVLPARELLADMLLLSGDYAGARTAYEAVLAISPNRLNSVAGLKEARSKLSKKESEPLSFEPEMVKLEGGTFQMGCVSGKYCRTDEKPVRDVTIKAFEMGRYEVTFDQWDECVQQKGCEFSPKKRWGGGNQPVVSMSWDDAQEYVTWLSGKTGKAYRLPSEAEWEYAARTNTKTPFSTGKCIHTDQANYKGDFAWDESNCPKTDKYQKQPVEVGSFAANDFGLFDMHGNLLELVQDCYHKNYDAAPNDGSAWETDCSKIENSVQRVYRGGSWIRIQEYLRSARRDRISQTHRPTQIHALGFRVARTL